MGRHVLVAMDKTKLSEDALEYALEEYPDAMISVVYVTEASDPLGLSGDRDPSEYMFPKCDFELDDERVPTESWFTRPQRKQAEYVLNRACALANTHNEEIELVVKSGKRVKEIVSCATEQAVDHIVIAEHRRRELRPLLRSVSRSVARNTSTPVTILAKGRIAENQRNYS